MTPVSSASTLWRALRRRCPNCGSRGISRHVAHVHDICPTCNLHIERKVGSFIGGIGLNTIVSFLCLLAVIVGGFISTGGDASITKILLPALAVALIVPLVFYASSRLLWVGIELIFWPLDDESANPPSH